MKMYLTNSIMLMQVHENYKIRKYLKYYDKPNVCTLSNVIHKRIYYVFLG